MNTHSESAKGTFFGWLVAGLAAGMILATVDLFSLASHSVHEVSPGAFSLNVALHLLGGFGAGMGLWSLSTVLGGWTFDQTRARLAALLNPIRAERCQRAAWLTSLIISVSVAASLLFLLNLRFMAFNNQSLAALLLVVAAFAVLLVTAALHHALQRHLGRLVTWAGTRWPMTGDSPLVWSGALVGLLLGSIVAAASVYWLVVVETWEALTIGPLLGLCVLVLLAAFLESVMRSWQPMAQWLGLALCVVSLFCWVLSFVMGPVTGEDNQQLHQGTWVANLYLTVAEKLTDRDHDGFSPLFGHGDCNDMDPSSWPGSPDGDDCLPDVSLDVAAQFTKRFRVNSTPPRAALPVVKAKAAISAAEAKAKGTPPPQKKRRPNILLITTNTIRDDHVGFADYERN
ncbi:MAG TPA: hypothetical protein EYN66_22460, partial [Myxococcales bacterium]|nr:hypothetical protein [Myxococcales bacterium]